MQFDHRRLHASASTREQCSQDLRRRPPSPYFNAASPRPYTDLKLRLSMLLPTESVAQAKALIDRGIGAGLRSCRPRPITWSPRKRRAIRAPASFRRPAGSRREAVHQDLQADVLEGARDVMIYETGMAQVDKLDTLRSVPAPWPTT
jgi:hypothetical protein